MTPEAQAATKYAAIAIGAAAAAIIAVTAPAAFAGNAGASLEACYNHVISACNNTKHPELCTNSGLDACDDYHKASAIPDGGLKIKILTIGGDRYQTIVTPLNPPRHDVYAKFGGYDGASDHQYGDGFESGSIRH